MQVSVYQDGTHGGSTLPAYFAQVFGVASQRIKATATARVTPANMSSCMRPWFISERFIDANGNNVYDPGTDTLDPYSVPRDIGVPVTFHLNGGPSGYGQLDVGSGGNAIENSIKYCAGTPFSIGDVALTKPGNTLGPEKQGIDALFDWDGGAGWNGTEVSGSCAEGGRCACPDSSSQCPYGGIQSPRVVQAALCTPGPSQPYCTGASSGAGTIVITNILSFFITGYTESAGRGGGGGGGGRGGGGGGGGGGATLSIHAIIIPSAGALGPGGSASPGGSFLSTSVLVR